MPENVLPKGNKWNVGSLKATAYCGEISLICWENIICKGDNVTAF